jgi:hypothetical protein
MPHQIGLIHETAGLLEPLILAAKDEGQEDFHPPETYDHPRMAFAIRDPSGAISNPGRDMKNKIRSITIALATAGSVLFGLPHFLDNMLPCRGIAEAQNDWKNEFEDICSKTQDPMALTADELRLLVGRCDALRPRIEKLDETQKKVYLKRLQMCRDLFAFVLESKEGK